MGLMAPLKHTHKTVLASSRSSVPLPMAVCLCLACLLIGYTAHRPGLPAGLEPQMVNTPPRKLQAQDPTAAAAAAGDMQPAQQIPQKQQQLAAAGELPDNEQFAQQFLQQSGLLQLRPPLQPAKSGSHNYTVVPYQILSWYPRIVVFPNFVDRERAQHIIKLASSRMQPSDLSYRPNEKRDPKQQIRTSTGVFLNSFEDAGGVLSWVEQKIAAVTLLPVTHGEAFNVLRYNLNQKYDSHMDTFDPRDFGPQPSQRMATVLLYLSEVEDGGETVFKKEGEDGADRPVTDWASCEPGEFKYKPRMGDAVLFFSLDPDLAINPRSLHGGCAVRSGEKWVATKWIHEKPFQRRRA